MKAITKLYKQVLSLATDDVLLNEWLRCCVHRRLGQLGIRFSDLNALRWMSDGVRTPGAIAAGRSRAMYLQDRTAFETWRLAEIWMEGPKWSDPGVVHEVVDLLCVTQAGRDHARATLNNTLSSFTVGMRD